MIDIKTKRVLIFNESYSSNFGDQAINKCLTEILKAKGIESETIYLSKPKIISLPYINYGKCNNNKDNNILATIKKMAYFIYWYIVNHTYLKNKINTYNTFIIGGGQLFNSGKSFFPNTFSIAMYWITKLIRKRPGYKLIFLGVGTSKDHTYFEEKLFKHSLLQASEILVRDSFSQKIFKQKYGVSSRVIPDLVFYNPKQSNTKKSKALIFVTDFRKVIKVIEEKIDREEYYLLLLKQLHEYQREGFHVTLAYTTKEDACESFKLQEYYKKNFNIDISIENIQDLPDLISLFKISTKVYASRMHALILAKKYGCTIKPHIISDKIRSFTEEYINEDLEILHKKLDALLNHQNNNESSLGNNI